MGAFDHCFYQHAYWGFDIGCGQQQMALRIDQLLTSNHGAFDLIHVKSPICPGLGGGGGGGGGGGVALTTITCITRVKKRKVKAPKPLNPFDKIRS